MERTAEHEFKTGQIRHTLILVHVLFIKFYSLLHLTPYSVTPKFKI